MLVEVADIVQKLVKIEDHDFFPFGQKVNSPVARYCRPAFSDGESAEVRE